MILIGSATSGAERRRSIMTADGSVEFFKGEWMESGDNADLSPTIFLAEQPANSVVLPHFHRENQWQVFVEGRGSLGRHPIFPLTVHYAGAYTGYGPVTAGPEGLLYFTIRPVLDTGALFVQGDRASMLPGPKAQASSEPLDTAALAGTDTLARCEVLELIAMRADGVGASLLRIPPHQPVPDVLKPVDPHPRGGRFFMVISGGVSFEDTALVRWESVFVSADEGPVAMRAGDVGAEVLIMATPPKATQYRAGHTNR